MTESGIEAGGAGEEVVPFGRVRNVENGIRARERLHGGKLRETRIRLESPEQAPKLRLPWPAPPSDGSRNKSSPRLRRSPPA